MIAISLSNNIVGAGRWIEPGERQRDKAKQQIQQKVELKHWIAPCLKFPLKISKFDVFFASAD